MSNNATPVVVLLDHKDPDEVYDLTFNFSRVMETAETISSYTLTTTDGVTVQSDASADQTVTAFYQSGDLGSTSELECEVVTSGGRTFKATRYLPIRVR